MKFVEAECLRCEKTELLPKLPNIEWCLWPFIHKDCEKKNKRVIDKIERNW